MEEAAKTILWHLELVIAPLFQMLRNCNVVAAAARYPSQHWTWSIPCFLWTGMARERQPLGTI